MKVEMRALDTVKPYEKNAKKHDRTQIDNVAESIRQYGFVQPIVVDKDGIIVIGHCRALGAKKLGLKQVPCVCVDDLTPEQVNALRLVDNKSNESDWDFDLLADELPMLVLDGFDFDWGLPEITEEVVEDEAPEVDEESEPITKLGDIWQLGRHRLMCGDSTSIDDVEKLMGGNKADMVFTDPPYNMNYCGAGFINQENKNVKERIKDIIDFDAKEISYLAQGNVANNVFIFTSKDLIKDYLVIFDSWKFNLLTWHKTNTPPMVNNNYFADTEYLLYFHKGKRVWNNGLKPIDIYKKYFVSSMGDGKKDAGADLHPTMKPLAIIENQVKICSKKDGIVVDIFGGSGSTLIACEQLDRTCYMMELDPKYCDVIIKRWENFTGEKAVLLNGDR